MAKLKWFEFSKNNEERSAMARSIAVNAQKSMESSKKKSSRAYSGAQLNRLTSDWVATLTSADAEIRGSLKTLRNRARELARNNDYVRQFLRAVQNNVVGRGIAFQPQVKVGTTSDLDIKINKQIEAAWLKWSNKNNCHTSGKLSFRDIERLLIRSKAESGEVLVRIVRKKFGSSKIPFALEILEADLLDDDVNGTSPEGREIRMGIELDEWGRPVFYYFKKSHPGDVSFTQQNRGNTRDHLRIPASEVIHLFRTERVGQTRGVTDLASAIVRLHHVSGYEEATIIQKRADASVMGFIESPEGEVRADDVANGESVTEFEPGVFKTLAPGEKVNIPQMSKSTGEYDPFMRSQLRAFAAGAGASYETVSRDYSQSNYSSSRLSLIDDRDNWRVEQDWMIENFHQPVFEEWLESAVLSGELNLPSFEIMPEKYTGVRWMPRGWSWVDPQKEVNASILAIDNGLATRADTLAQSGSDFNEVMEQLKHENEVARKLGLVFRIEGNASQNNGDGKSSSKNKKDIADDN